MPPEPVELVMPDDAAQVLCLDLEFTLSAGIAAAEPAVNVTRAVIATIARY